LVDLKPDEPFRLPDEFDAAEILVAVITGLDTLLGVDTVCVGQADRSSVVTPFVGVI